MPLIVPGVCRFTINQRYGGRNVANVLDMFIDTTGGLTTRPDACNDQAGILINQWKGDIMPRQSSTLTLQSVSWVDLDDDDGSVGARTSTATVTLPQPGTAASTAMPGNVSVLVRKNVTAQRGARRGRMYVCGVPEGDTDSSANNELGTTYLANWTTNVNSFFNNCEQEDIDPTNYQSYFVVVHVTAWAIDPDTGNKLPTNGVGLNCTSFSVDKTLATQRRRLRG